MPRNVSLSDVFIKIAVGTHDRKDGFLLAQPLVEALLAVVAFREAVGRGVFGVTAGPAI